MNIPPFNLPSDASTLVYFRVPSVKDSIDFAELDQNQEEAGTTQYLNQLQDKKKYKNGEIIDSAEWTGEDRRTALWWIHINTRPDPTLAISYHCDHCNESHYPIISLPELGMTAKVLKTAQPVSISFFSGGTKYSATVKSLNGHSLEHIENEKLRLSLVDENSKEARQLKNQIALLEMAHCISVVGQPANHDDALEYKTNLIMGMQTESEFRSFCASVEKSLRSMRHGLLMQRKDNQYYLVATHADCKKKEGNNADLALLLPFQAFEFIQTI